MGKHSRRAALGSIALGAGVLITDTVAFSSLEGERVSNASVTNDSAALIGLKSNIFDTNSDAPTEPQVMTVTNRSEVKFDSDDTIKISSKNDKYRFKVNESGRCGSVGTNDTYKTINTGNIPDTNLPLKPKDFFDICVITKSNQTGEVVDTIIFELESDDNIKFEIRREAILQFDASSQLVYGVDPDDGSINGNIQLYGSVNEAISDPEEDEPVNSIGSIVADITNDNNADIAYSKSNDGGGGKVELTQIGIKDENNLVTVFDSANNSSYPVPNLGDTRISAGDLSNFPVDSASLSDAVALFTNNSADNIYAGDIDTNGNNAVELLVETSNIGGAGAVSGIGDIDNDGVDELIYTNSSQGLRFIKPIDVDKYDNKNNPVKAWRDSQSNYDKVIKKYRKGNDFNSNETITDSTIGDQNSGSEWAYGKVKLGNTSVGSNANLGISALGNFSDDNKKYIPHVNGSNVLSFVDHTNTVTKVKGSSFNTNSVALKSAIAPVNFDDDDATELAFIGKLGATDGSENPDRSNNGPLPDVDDTPSSVNIPSGEGPVYYLANPKGVIDNGDTPTFKLVQVPESQQDNPSIIDSGDTQGVIIPSSDLGLNAGTVID